MKNLQDFLNVAFFLGDEITDEQAARLMDEAKQNLSIADIETLLHELPGTPFWNAFLYRSIYLQCGNGWA